MVFSEPITATLGNFGGRGADDHAICRTGRRNDSHKIPGVPMIERAT